MVLPIYSDAHIPKAISNGLKLRGIDVLTSQEDNTTELPDEELLIRATQLKRIILTFDDDFLTIAAKFISTGKNFTGIIFTHPINIKIITCIEDIEIIAKVMSYNEIQNRILFIPL